MKRLPAALAAALFSAFLLPSFSPAQEIQPYERVVQRLGKAAHSYNVRLHPWKYSKGECGACLDPNFEPKKWKTGGIGFVWTEQETDVWFWKKYAVPTHVEGIEVKGSQVFVRVAMESDGEIYVNGEFQQAFRGDEGYALVSRNAVPGEEYVIVVKGKYRRGPTGAFLDAHLEFTATEDVQQRTNDYISKIDTVRLFMENSPDPAKWTDVLNDSASLIDLDAREKRDYTAYLASLEKATARLAPFREIARDYKMYLLGYSHIDLAWLWDYREGEQVWFDTARTVFKLMKEYPDFVFTETQAHGYKWMEDDHPEIYRQLHEWFKAGRWEITGGSWSEFDSNLPDGESFVRQFLYGKRYFREKFNKDVIIGWTPDSFGYNWNLPQIMRKSGMIGFLTQKINWNDTTRFPYHVFWWEGPDGSKILTYFPVGGYGESVDAPRMIEQLKQIKQKHDLNENFVIFGVGDHGGGVTRGHLNRASALKNNDIYPEIIFTSAEDYFKHLHELAKEKNFPTYNDELYLEFHRGTYTTQAKTKRNNRLGEVTLMNAEKFASIASLAAGEKYPAPAIFDGWYVLMLNHMHDILPGSGINKVYQDADRDYAGLLKTERGVIENALDAIAGLIDTSGDGVPIVIFNPLGWRRDGIVEITADGLAEKPAVLDPAGVEIPSQTINRGNGRRLLFIARRVPPLGYSVYRIVEKKTPP
ncbi:MAG: hypothetical protein AB1742_10705 [bacterium]